VFNAAGTAKILRIYRAYHFNNSLTSVTGVLTTLRVTRTTAASGGSSVTPVAHDTANAALDANTTGGTGRTVTASDVFRQYIYSNDEPTVSGSSMDEWELFVPFAEVWNAGYADANVQPIVCRAGQGFQLLHQGSSAVGAADFEIEFTSAAS
jgi:hypothetical protein